VAALERGEMSVDEFETLLAAEFERRGATVEGAGLLSRMLAGLEVAEPRMAEVVRRAKSAGLATGLLSNSWGNSYNREGWDELFDVVVISGEVGMRKPEPRIFDHTAGLLGLPPTACVMVDDLEHNVAAARAAGMAAVLHRDVDSTVAELTDLLGLDLSDV
jgi:putative hydrolase of the HAD superfamily